MTETYKSGQEISFNGGTWGMIEEVVGDTIWVTDEDGGDHELTDARIDAIIPAGQLRNEPHPYWASRDIEHARG